MESGLGVKSFHLGVWTWVPKSRVGVCSSDLGVQTVCPSLKIGSRLGVWICSLDFDSGVWTYLWTMNLNLESRLGIWYPDLGVKGVYLGVPSLS